MPTGGGGGGGGGEVRAGGAYVEVYGKDLLTKQLEDIKTKASGLTAGIGKFAGAIGLGLSVAKVASIGLDIMRDKITKQHQFNAALEATARAAARADEAWGAARERTFAQVGGKLPEVANVVGGDDRDVVAQSAARADRLQREARLLKDSTKGIDDYVSKLRQELAVLEEEQILKKHDPTDIQAILQQQQIDKKKQEIDITQRHSDATRKATDELKEQIKAQQMRPQQEIRDWSRGVEDNIQAINRQTKALSMTSSEAAIFNAEQDLIDKGLDKTAKGATELALMMERLKKALDMSEAAGSLKNLVDFNKDLDFRISTQGMNSDQVALQKMREEFEKTSPTKLQRRKFESGMLKAQENIEKMLPLAGINTKGTFSGPLSQQLGIGDRFRWEARMTKAAEESADSLASIDAKTLGEKAREREMNFK